MRAGDAGEGVAHMCLHRPAFVTRHRIGEVESIGESDVAQREGMHDPWPPCVGEDQLGGASAQIADQRGPAAKVQVVADAEPDQLPFFPTGEDPKVGLGAFAHGTAEVFAVVGFANCRGGAGVDVRGAQLLGQGHEARDGLDAPGESVLGDVALVHPSRTELNLGSGLLHGG